MEVMCFNHYQPYQGIAMPGKFMTMSEISIEKFNQGDQLEYDKVYTKFYDEILEFVVNNIIDEAKAIEFTKKSFQLLKEFSPRDFKSVTAIKRWVADKAHNMCLEYDKYNDQFRQFGLNKK